MQAKLSKQDQASKNKRRSTETRANEAHADKLKHKQAQSNTGK